MLSTGSRKKTGQLIGPVRPEPDWVSSKARLAFLRIIAILVSRIRNYFNYREEHLRVYRRRRVLHYSYTCRTRALMKFIYYIVNEPVRLKLISDIGIDGCIVQCIDRGMDRGIDWDTNRGIDRCIDRCFDRGIDEGIDRCIDRAILIFL